MGDLASAGLPRLGKQHFKPVPDRPDKGLLQLRRMLLPGEPSQVRHPPQGCSQASAVHPRAAVACIRAGSSLAQESATRPGATFKDLHHAQGGHLLREGLYAARMVAEGELPLGNDHRVGPGQGRKLLRPASLQGHPQEQAHLFDLQARQGLPGVGVRTLVPERIKPSRGQLAEGLQVQPCGPDTQVTKGRSAHFGDEDRP